VFVNWSALIPRPLLPQGEGKESIEKAFQVPHPEGEGFRVRAQNQSNFELTNTL
jgi:hypothetical protein